MRKQYEAEKEELAKQIGQLTIEVNWLKKNLLNSTSAEERREMPDRNEKGITVKKQAELLEVNRTSVYYRIPNLREFSLREIKNPQTDNFPRGIRLNARYYCKSGYYRCAS